MTTLSPDRKAFFENQTRTEKNSKVYQIHDNGGVPFYVVVNSNNVVDIYQNMDDFEIQDKKEIFIKQDPEYIMSIDADKVFIGNNSPFFDSPSRNYKPSFVEGNTILLKKGKKYIFIYRNITEIEMIENDPIEEFYSDIGNNDVPYPYGIGKKYIYLFLDKIAIDKKYFKFNEDIYWQYYDNLKGKVKGIFKFQEKMIFKNSY